MKKDKTWAELDDLSKPFLPDETHESATAVAIELRSRIVKLEQQMMSQYTAMAAYATIGQRDVETCRAESRADLDRAQATMIGLIEKARHEAAMRIEGVSAAAGAGVGGAADPQRLAQMEQRMVTLGQLLERVARENVELRRQLAALTEAKMTAEGWLVADGNAEVLALR